MVIGIDDLLIAAAVTAIASYAASEISAGQEEDYAKDAAGRQKKNALDAQRVNYYLDRAAKLGVDTTGMEAWAKRGQIEHGYNEQMDQIDRTRSLRRDQGLTNGVAGFLSKAVASGYSNAGSGGSYSPPTGINNAGAYDLTPSDYGLGGGAHTEAFTPQSLAPQGTSAEAYLGSGQTPQLNPDTFGLGDASQYDPNDDQYGFLNPSRFRL